MSSSFLIKAVVCSLLVLIGGNVAARDAARPATEFGANLYFNRCALCHGTSGMGDGILPLTLGDYPKTNLHHPNAMTDWPDIRRAIAMGGADGSMSIYAPPMKDGMTDEEIDAVTDFVVLLKKDRNAAVSLIQRNTEELEPSLELGSQLFSTRCALCHGKTGAGDGRMARIIKSPAPANLVRSKVPDKYVEQIISLGGEAMGRSPQMPPWGDQFNDYEIKSLVIFLNSLRIKP